MSLPKIEHKIFHANQLDIDCDTPPPLVQHGFFLSTAQRDQLLAILSGVIISPEAIDEAIALLSDEERPIKCAHWPGQKRCEVCGMNEVKP